MLVRQKGEEEREHVSIQERHQEKINCVHESVVLRPQLCAFLPRSQFRLSTAFFCRYYSTHKSIGQDEKQFSPRDGTVERFTSTEIHDPIIFDQDSQVYNCQVPESTLRASWRGPYHTTLGKSHGRRQSAQVDSKYKFAEPFCGAGGPSLGARKAGLEVLFAFDKDSAAIKTYNHAIRSESDRPVETEVMAAPEYVVKASRCSKYIVDFLHMSPPCQTFCAANVRADPTPEELKIKLEAFHTVGQLLQAHKPQFTTIEEVPGLAKFKNHKYFQELLGCFIDNGFNIRWEQLKLELFGVPQTRYRIIFIAAA